MSRPLWTARFIGGSIHQAEHYTGPEIMATIGPRLMQIVRALITDEPQTPDQATAVRAEAELYLRLFDDGTGHNYLGESISDFYCVACGAECEASAEQTEAADFMTKCAVCTVAGR